MNHKNSKWIAARVLSTRPDRIEIIAEERDSLNQRVIDVKFQSYPYRIIEKDGVVLRTYRLI